MSRMYDFGRTVTVNGIPASSARVVVAALSGVVDQEAFTEEPQEDHSLSPDSALD